MRESWGVGGENDVGVEGRIQMKDLGREMNDVGVG